MKERGLQIALILACMYAAHAQQVFTMPVVNLDRIDFNPSITGSNESTSFFLANRSGQNLRYTMAQGETFLPKKSTGLGMLVESYQSLLETQNSIRLNLSYRLKTEKGFWQMGLAPVIHNYRINIDNLNIRNQEDALSPQNNVNRWAMNFNAGIMYKTNKVLCAISAQNISKSLNPLASDYAYLIEYQQYTLFSSYAFNLTDTWKLIPAVYAQHVSSQGDYIAGAGKLKNEYIVIGFQYGMHHTWAASAAFVFPAAKKACQTMLGYSFAQGNNGLVRNFNHEVFLSFAFEKQDRKNSSLKQVPQYRSPIYF